MFIFGGYRVFIELIDLSDVMQYNSLSVRSQAVLVDRLPFHSMHLEDTASKGLPDCYVT